MGKGRKDTKKGKEIRNIVNGEKSKVKCKGNVKGDNKPNELQEIICGKRTKKITIGGAVKRKGKGRDQKKKGRKREKDVTNGHGKGIELWVKEDKLEKRKDEGINNSQVEKEEMNVKGTKKIPPSPADCNFCNWKHNLLVKGEVKTIAHGYVLSSL